MDSDERLMNKEETWDWIPLLETRLGLSDSVFETHLPSNALGLVCTSKRSLDALGKNSPL